MQEQKEHRRYPRETLNPPKNGILYVQSNGHRRPNSKETLRSLHVNVLNISQNGILIQSPMNFKPSAKMYMHIRRPHENIWAFLKGEVKWANDYPSQPGYYRAGIECREEKQYQDFLVSHSESKDTLMTPSELEFLLSTSLFNSINQESICPLLNNLTFRSIKAGERFITQGDEGDNLYIIRSGSCIVTLEKDMTLHPIVRLKEGDIVGEMAVLTGEKRSTHVDAETEMNVWSLSAKQFDALCQAHPDLRNVLTDIISERFSSSKLTAFRTIGKYIIKDVLGQGGWSIVYKGIHGRLNFPVAIKMMKHNMAMDSDFLTKFNNEAMIIARLNHPNIIKVYDIEEIYKTVFIMMEYLEGFSLDYILEHLPNLSLSKTLDIILQICSGLDYAHKQGIIHQDIKPANIFIQHDEVAKIVDFGLACPTGNVDFDLPGTLFYMSPEQIQGEPVDERTDIYSLGITVYEMLTGKRPFPEDDLSKIMDFHLKEDVPDPRLIIPDLPEELHALIIKSIRRDPEKRIKNISELIQLIQPLAEKLGLQYQVQHRKKRKMMTFFLSYQDDQQLILNQLIEKFGNDLTEAGVKLQVTQVENV